MPLKNINDLLSPILCKLSKEKNKILFGTLLLAEGGVLMIDEAYAGRDANTWGNARFVANLLEHIYLAHAKRCVNYAFAEDAPTIKKCFTITPADVQPIDVPKPKPHVGF